MKHISQSPQNRATLGSAGVLEALSKSKIWDESSDMAQIVQISAIAVAKHLCTSSGKSPSCLFNRLPPDVRIDVLTVKNTLRLALPPTEPESDETPTGIDQIFDLIRRSDTLALQSEATRVLVNVIKSLWSAPAEGEDVDPARRRAAIDVVTNEDTADALSELIGRNRKYPVLLNEGVVALTLLAGQPAGSKSIVRTFLNRDEALTCCPQCR